MHERKLKITQFREILVDQMLELEKQNESIVNEPSTSGNKRSKGNTKHYFQETTEKCNRNRKLRKVRSLLPKYKRCLSILF